MFSSLFVGGGGSTAAAASPVLGSLVAASITAEIVGSSALTPLEAARIRMVADTEYAPGLRSGIARMVSEEGLGALTRGLPAVLAKQIPYTVTKLVTFDVLVRSASKAARYRGGAGGGALGGVGVGATMACAVAAGILSSLASQPGDSLLSTLNTEGRSSGGWEEGEEECDREPVACAMARIARDAGFFGLFRGTPARMMHVTSIVTVQLLIYQSVKRMVGIRS